MYTVPALTQNNKPIKKCVKWQSTFAADSDSEDSCQVRAQCNIVTCLQSLVISVYIYEQHAGLISGVTEWRRVHIYTRSVVVCKKECLKVL